VLDWRLARNTEYRALTVSRLDAVMVYMARKSTAQQSPASRTSRKRTRAFNGNGNGRSAKLDAKTLRALRAMSRNIRKYTPIIEKKLRAAGVKPNPALVYSAAKYYEALDRLAKE